MTPIHFLQEQESFTYDFINIRFLVVQTSNDSLPNRFYYRNIFVHLTFSRFRFHRFMIDHSDLHKSSRSTLLTLKTNFYKLIKLSTYNRNLKLNRKYRGWTLEHFSRIDQRIDVRKGRRLNRKYGRGLIVVVYLHQCSK